MKEGPYDATMQPEKAGDRRKKIVDIVCNMKYRMKNVNELNIYTLKVSMYHYSLLRGGVSWVLIFPDHHTIRSVVSSG